MSLKSMFLSLFPFLSFYPTTPLKSINISFRENFKKVFHVVVAF